MKGVQEYIFCLCHQICSTVAVEFNVSSFGDRMHQSNACISRCGIMAFLFREMRLKHVYVKYFDLEHCKVLRIWF